MKLSNRQKAILHKAAAAAGHDEARRRQVQRSIGGFNSCCDRSVTREGFIAVMAYFEGECHGQLPGFTPGYWFGQSLRAEPLDALKVSIRREAQALGWSEGDTESFLASEHLSRGRFRRIQEAPPYWLSRLLDALKAIRKRRENDPAKKGDDHARPATV